MTLFYPHDHPFTINSPSILMMPDLSQLGPAGCEVIGYALARPAAAQSATLTPHPDASSWDITMVY